MSIINYLKYLEKWLKDEVDKTNAEGVVVGISGGVDSAIVSAIAKKSFPNNSLGIIMPIGDMKEDLHDAKKLVNTLNINYKIVDLTQSFKALSKTLSLKSSISIMNIKPRLRMITLYAIAQEHNYLVLGTDNFNEWLLGYFTKYGDGAADILPIVRLTKTQVYEAAKIYGIPKSIITKKPSAGLIDNQYDEDELGFKYSDFEKYILNEYLDRNIINKIKQQINKTAHKRDPIPRPNAIDEA